MQRLDAKRLFIALSVIGVMLLWVAMEWPCVIRTISGIPCPGCGLSRAWLAALRLDLAQAFRYHPMFWSIPILMLYCLFDGRVFQRKWLDIGILAFLLGGMAVCYAIRIVVFLSGGLAI